MKKIHDALEIYSIHIGELTASESAAILKSWGDDTPLSKLTVVFTRERLLVSADYKDLNMEELVLNIVSKSREQRREIREKMKTETVKSIMDVVEQFLDYAEAQKDIELLKYQYLPFRDMTLTRIVQEARHNPNGMGIWDAYAWGVIVGKRDERARRKATRTS